MFLTEMRKKIGIGLAALGVLASSVGAQEVKRPPLLVPQVSDSVLGFAPAGWRVEKERIQGADLNNDGRTDAAFVLSNGGSSEANQDEPAKREDKYAVENLEMLLDPSSPYGDSQGFQLAASLEIVDVDNSAPRIGGVLSTRLAGSPYPGAIRIFRKGTLILESDVLH